MTSQSYSNGYNDGYSDCESECDDIIKNLQKMVESRDKIIKAFYDIEQEYQHLEPMGGRFYEYVDKFRNEIEAIIKEYDKNEG